MALGFIRTVGSTRILPVTVYARAGKVMRVLLALPLLWVSGISTAQELDPTTGLKMATGWQAVSTTCIRCHSASVITQSSGSREVWKSRIVWMQETQGLEQLENETEVQILDYLAENYAQKAASRRTLIAQKFLPPNPYTQ